MNPPTARIGFWAALVAVISGLAYIAALVASFAGMLAGTQATAYQLAPSIVLAWSYLVLMACVLDAASRERRIWATIGFALALMYSVINSIVYFTQLTVVIPRIVRGEAAPLAVLLFEPGTFMFAINGLAYGLMSVAALFASPALSRPGREARARWTMVAHGVIGPFIVGAVVWPPLTYVGALWILTFPAMTLSLTLVFRHAR